MSKEVRHLYLVQTNSNQRLQLIINSLRTLRGIPDRFKRKRFALKKIFFFF